MSSLFGDNFPAWRVQTNISVPVSPNVAAASMAAAKIQIQQNVSQMKQVELQIATDVTNVAISIRNDIQAVRAAQAAQTSRGEHMMRSSPNSSWAVHELQCHSGAPFAQRDQDQLPSSSLELSECPRRARSLEHTTLNALNITVLGNPSWTSASPVVSNLNGAPVGSAR